MVVGDREVHNIEHFSPLKKTLQKLGSWVVRQASSTDVPDTTSGFRAYNREAAIQLIVVSKFTYTLETIIQAGKLLVAVDHVAIRTNPKTRESRLFPSMWSYVRRNSVSIFRIYSQYEPLKVFMSAALLVGTIALVVWARFAYFYVFEDEGKGHVQSLILGAVLFNAAMVLAALGVMGDLLAAQRTIAQRTFERVRRIELQLGVEPSHYEPGAKPTGHGKTTGADAGRRDRQDRGARGVAAVSPASPAVTVDAEGTVTGNTYDKYGSSNPVVRRLMAAFERTLDELFTEADPDSLLDVGCGEGVLTHEWAAQARRAPDRRHRPRRPAPARRVGQAPGAEPHLPGHEGREPALRRRRVRRRDGDRGARARARPRAHGRRDGARRERLAARVGTARAAVARAEHGPRGATSRSWATRPGT